ncbi:MAG: flagellin FliC [Oligoflexales bacterium]|nr:flagellin FliC [Oligoflexales bacterium]
MGMRIRTNVTSLVAQRHLSNNNKTLGESLERLSSGYRINKSRDDAAGLAVSENMRGKIRGLNQAKRNANDAVSMLQVAEGAMNEMGNILIRMRELTVQASSDTLGDRDRSFLNREYVQLANEIDRIASTAEFNENKFFIEDGDNPRTEYIIQVGPNNTAAESNQDTLSINLEGLKFTTEDLGINTGSEIGPINMTEEGPSRNDIAGKLTTIDSALERVASERATLGSMQSRLDSTINNLSISIENLNTSMSRIRDVDYASETSLLAKQRILSQSNLSVLSQANQLPEMALSLLR